MFRIIYLFLLICLSKGFPYPVSGFGMRVGDKIIKVEKLEDNKPFENQGSVNHGMDERYETVTHRDHESISKIDENFQKIKMLKTLENIHLSVEYKLALIRENSHLSDIFDNSLKVINLYEGGLHHEFDDWSDEI